MVILASPLCIPSSKILRDSIEKISGKRFLVTSKPERVTGKIVIRYGNSIKTNFEDTNLNNPDFIRLCGNKLTTSSILLGSGIYTPQYFTEKIDMSYPCLIRKTLTGMKGRGIIYCPDEETFDRNFVPGNWWTHFRNISNEYRVHVVSGEIIRIFSKKLLEGVVSPIRNNEHCHFSIKNTDKFPKLVPIINTIHTIIQNKGVENYFYALDVGWDATKKEYFVFELNSAPGLNENTAEAYAEKLTRVLNL